MSYSSGLPDAAYLFLDLSSSVHGNCLQSPKNLKISSSPRFRKVFLTNSNQTRTKLDTVLLNSYPPRHTGRTVVLPKALGIPLS
jgi:hypothetical protein